MEENQKKIKRTIVATKITTKISKIRIEEKAELAETAPSCNDCVATIVARPFTTTVKGKKTAFRKEDKGVFPRIQEFGRVSGFELKLFYINF